GAGGQGGGGGGIGVLLCAGEIGFPPSSRGGLDRHDHARRCSTIVDRFAIVAFSHSAAKSIGVKRSSVRSLGGSGYLRPVAQLKSMARSSRRIRPSARPCLTAA